MPFLFQKLTLSHSDGDTELWAQGHGLKHLGDTLASEGAEGLGVYESGARSQGYECRVHCFFVLIAVSRETALVLQLLESPFSESECPDFVYSICSCSEPGWG